MKFNWGHGIALFLVVFVITTVGVVILISTDDTYSHELVSEDYYEEELKYQEEIDKVNNAATLSSPVIYRTSEKGILLTFPKDFAFDRYVGTIYMKRPSKKILDFSTPIKLDENYQILLPSDKAIEGKWKLKIDWKVGKDEYMFKANVRR